MKKVSFLSFFLILLCLFLTAFVACDGVGDLNELPSSSVKDAEVENESNIDGEDARDNEFEFTSNGDGTCTLTAVVYVNGALTIPEISPDGEKVTSIGSGAFRDCNSITSLTVPDCIENIKDSAFMNCHNLKRVMIGNGLKAIQTDAFYNCTSLEEVHISDLSAWCRVMIYNSYANPIAYGNTLYLNGEIVTDLVIPNDISTIRQYTFDYCTSIVSVTLHNKVSKIEYGAFSCCTFIEEVNVSESLESIGDYAFYCCTSLKKVPTLDSVKSIGKYAFAKCESLTQLHVPEGIESIGEYAFKDCMGIKELTIDIKAHGIDDKAFSDCNYIEKAIVPANMSAKINYTNMHDLIVCGKGDLPSEMCAFAENLSCVMILDGVEKIGEKTFKGCLALEKLVLPGSISKIGNDAFEYCVALKTVYFMGTEEEWNAIVGIDELPKGTTVVFNYTPDQ